MNVKRSLFLYAMLLGLFSCAKDETKIMLTSTPVPAQITTAATTFQGVLTKDLLENSLSMNWNAASYGVSTEVTYSIEVDVKCNSFSNPVVIGSTSTNTASIALADLNTRMLGDLKLTAHKATDLQLRLVSRISNQFPAYSEPISFTITPWSDTPVGLWLASSSWTVDKNAVVYSTGQSQYEGYTHLGKDTAFQFTTKKVCLDTIYGGTAGQLALGSSSSAILIPASGYYKVDADTKNMTYAVTQTTWGLIGSATPGGWNASTPMTYDKTKKVWNANVDLINGALKFRANDAWDINYGPADIDALQGTLIQTNDAINIATTANYDVTIDFSQSKAPYQYTYTVVKTDNATKPVHLWVPGGYEGFNPAVAPTLSSLTSSAKTFEGYVNITSSTGIKFTSDPDYNHTNYGDGGAAGTLSTSGADINVPNAGYYKINVDINALTYTITPITTMGLIGTATPGQWDTSTPMAFNATTGLWSKTLNLANGALKFRANDVWDINYGPSDSGSLDGTLIFNDPGSINITEPGNYTVVVDFSRGAAPYQYSYTVTKN